MQNTAKINALPDDAPATAVIAAWAGKSTGKPFRFDDAVLVDLADGIWQEIDEPTLRRWLLDGRVQLCEFKSSGKYVQELDGLGIGKEVVGEADTPEAAFASAVEQFADALRENAKHDAENA